MKLNEVIDRSRDLSRACRVNSGRHVAALQERALASLDLEFPKVDKAPRRELANARKMLGGS